MNERTSLIQKSPFWQKLPERFFGIELMNERSKVSLNRIGSNLPKIYVYFGDNVKLVSAEEYLSDDAINFFNKVEKTTDNKTRFICIARRIWYIKQENLPFKLKMWKRGIYSEVSLLGHSNYKFTMEPS